MFCVSSINDKNIHLVVQSCVVKGRINYFDMFTVSLIILLQTQQKASTWTWLRLSLEPVCVYWRPHVYGLEQNRKSLAVTSGFVSPTCYCVSCALLACVLCGCILYYIITLCDWPHVFIEAVK